MAYEIQIDIGAPGLTGLYCRPWQGTTGGNVIALTEIAGAGGVYGNAGAVMLAEGEYVLRGYDSADSLIARSGVVVWDGSDFANPATLAQVQAAGFTTDRNNALIAADLAARALADGRYIIDYTASTATQYDADGTVRTVFNLLDADGTTPATTAATAVERVPE